MPILQNAKKALRQANKRAVENMVFKKAYKDALKHIKKEWLTINTEVIGKLPIDGAIEDLFSKEDFVKFVVGDPTVLITGRNSDFMKGKDKVLLAKKFVEKPEEYDFYKILEWDETLL